jgi:hypothetical protein
MTTPPPDIAAVAGKLTSEQRGWIKDAEMVEGDIFVVLDDEHDPLPATIRDDITGILTSAGLALRQHLLENGSQS